MPRARTPLGDWFAQLAQEPARVVVGATYAMS